jgi:hypothetical protein
VFTSILDVLGCLVQLPCMFFFSTIFELSAPFSEMLHTHYTTVVHLYQFLVNFNGRNMLPIKTGSQYEHLRRTMFSVSLPLHINLKCIPLAFDWLTLAPFVACYPFQVVPPTEKQNAWLTWKLQAGEPCLLNMISVKGKKATDKGSSLGGLPSWGGQQARWMCLLL